MPREAKVVQRWKCPKCSKEQTMPIPAVSSLCSNKHTAAQMELIEGEAVKPRPIGRRSGK